MTDSNPLKNNQHHSLLSISIVVYSLEAGLLVKLLGSLSIALDKLQLENNSVEIKIIDNGNQEQALNRACAQFRESLSGLSIISGIRNIGYGRAHNLAILPTSSTYHLILNPDVILDESSLAEGITYLQMHEDVCAVSPASRDEHGNVQYLSKRYPSVLDLALRGIAPKFIRNLFSKRLNNYELKEIIETDKPADVDIISGCFMLCRTDFLKKIGGFDDRYFLYFEDFALSMELKKMGSLHYLPSMKIIHYGGNAARKGLKHFYLFINSGVKFFNQYGWKFR